MRFLDLALASTALHTFTVFAIPTSSCRYLPGDAGWPATQVWSTLNSTVGGRLVATIPLGSPCHDSAYNATECAILQNEWRNAQLHMVSSSSIMAPFFANQSCDPFQPESRPCTLGNYVNYAVNVSKVDDVVAAVKFAHMQNVRLVIRNTGHDYIGRSTGKGALGVWTHYLKDISFSNWSDSHYSGKAIKVGAGVQGFEAMAAAKAQGLVIVGGECPTVGIAGGYSQGGGHSALSTSFGLAADNTLSFEVVTARGKLVTASRTENPDLYWALSGGGGGNYGVVVSMTSKAHPDAVVGGATLIFYSSSTTVDTFFNAIETFHSLMPAMVDAGAMVIYYFSTAFFEIGPITAYGKTEAETKAILAPFLAALDKLAIPYTSSFTESTTYWDHYNTYLGPLPYGNIQVGIAQYGGRLIPRSVVEHNNTALTATLRGISEKNVLFIGVGVNVSSTSVTAGVSNSVLPAWRDAVIDVTFTTPWNFTAPWSDMLALQDLMTNEIIPAIEAVTPGSGAYMNEADFRQPNWQETFFGSNYDALLCVKKEWDPENLFYALHAVGSEAWIVASDGRLCSA